MADLFKKPQDPALPLRPAHAAAPAPSSSQPKPQPEGSEPNGWGLPHVADAVCPLLGNKPVHRSSPYF